MLGNPQCHAKKTTKLKNNENNRNKTFGLNLSKHNGENKRHVPKGIRSSRRTHKNKNCVITIISSDEDDGYESEALVEDVYAVSCIFFLGSLTELLFFTQELLSVTFCNFKDG